jgi:cytochrome d ubiquinol oxidase subunit I
MELAYEPEARAPLRLGGVLVGDEVRGDIPIPWLGSLISRSNVDRTVPGLSQFPPEDRPPANVVHFAFQTMVGAGTAMAAIAVWFAFRWWKARRDGRDPLGGRWILRAAVASGVLAVVALQAGWTTTEVGRQPWIVFGVMRVEDAVTTNGGIWISLTVTVVVYTLMAIGAVSVLRGMAQRWRRSGSVDLPTPYEIPDRADAGSVGRR